MPIFPKGILLQIIFVLTLIEVVFGHNQHHHNYDDKNNHHHQQDNYHLKLHCPPDSSHLTLLPHPFDCTKFFYCVHRQPVLFDCPSSLHFNPKLMVCDWPDRAGCKAGAKETTTKKPTTTTTKRPKKTKKPKPTKKPRTTTTRRTPKTAKPTSPSTTVSPITQRTTTEIPVTTTALTTKQTTPRKTKRPCKTKRPKTTTPTPTTEADDDSYFSTSSVDLITDEGSGW